MKKAAKQLKRNKALGPDEVPNELFIEANNYTIQLLTDQKMLDITNEISSRYRIVFGKEKSKVMKMGSSVQTELKLGDMEIEETD